MIRLVSLMLSIFIAPSVHAVAPVCMDLFQQQVTSTTDFSEMDIQHVEENIPSIRTPSPVHKWGNVTLTGQNRYTGNWELIATVGYTVKGTALTINRLIERPELYGQGIYTRMIESILQKNLQIQSVTISLTGTFFDQYREDLKALGDSNQALLKNPVFQQFESLGFKNVAYVFELSNLHQIYLRLTLRRPQS